jgi:hypothetical protein
MSVVVAERQIGYANLGSIVQGRVSIEAPQPDQNDWRCEYVVALPGHERRAYAMGIDSFQALHLAMQAAVAEVSRTEAFKNGHLTVFDEPILTLDDLKQCFGLSRILGH